MLPAIREVGSTPVTIALMASELVVERLHERNTRSRAFFGQEAERLVDLAERMAERFTRGGRLLALGGPNGESDAQHVVVEFVHPVLVGKRALPALDVTMRYVERLRQLTRADDIVMAFGTDVAVETALRDARSRGALTVALPGPAGDYAIAAPAADPFISQEIIEVLYHTLWETVHVILEQQPLSYSAGAASFLYPFLDSGKGVPVRGRPELIASLKAKVAETERLRAECAGDGAQIVVAAQALAERLARGGCVLCLGNGGSATDANDLAIDLVASPKAYAGAAAISLAAEPATLTALANDVGSESLFARQIMALGTPMDAVIAFSTSGASANIVAALHAARARGLLTIALVGYDGGDIQRQQLADHVLVVKSDHIPRIQEIHASLYHVLLDVLDVLRRPH